MVRVLQN